MPPLNAPSYIYQNLLARPDNTYDIGANGANRPRNLFVGTAVYVGVLAALSGNLSLGGGGVSQWAITPQGQILPIADITYDIGSSGNRPRHLYAGGNAIINGGIGLGSGPVNLYSTAQGVFEVQYGGAATSIRVYNTYTDSNNYARLNINTYGEGSILWEKAGTGPAAGVEFGTTTFDDTWLTTNGQHRWRVGGSGHLYAGTDNTFDIGDPGGVRPRNVYVASELDAGILLTSASLIYLDSAKAQYIQITGTNTNLVISKPLTMFSSILWNADNTYDIGGSGSNRPRNIYVGTSFQAPAGSISTFGDIVASRNSNSGAIYFGSTGNNTYLYSPSPQQVYLNALLLMALDNTYDIGQSGANRPRNIFVGGFFSGNGAVPNGGAQNYALTKQSSTDYDVIWTPVATPSDVTNLQNQINTLQSQVADLQTRLSTAETNITAINTHNNTQDQAISDLQQRVTALEQGSASKSGPFIGDLVHVKDDKNHCQPAICYEDWDGKNANGTISVAVLSPIRLSDSPWDSYIEVHEQNGVVEPPFTTWHWPEMAFQYRRELFRKIAERSK